MASTTHDGRLVPDADERFGGGDLDAVDEEGRRGPPRRRRGLTAFVVIVGALAIAAGAWYVTKKLSNTASESTGELPLLIAETEPVKVKPQDPGGAEIPNRGTYVYKSLENEPAEQPVEQLLPAPEEPMPKPVDTGPILEPVGSVSLGDMWQRQAPAPSVAEAPAPDLTRLLEQAVGEGEVAAPSVSPEAGGSQPDASFSPEAPSEVAVRDADDLPEAGEAPAAAGSEGGGIWLQVASLQNESDVDAEWSRLVKRYPETLGAAERRVVSADLGARGLWYRVQAGPFADVPAAEAACRSIAAAGGSCQVVKP